MTKRTYEGINHGDAGKRYAARAMENPGNELGFRVEDVAKVAESEARESDYGIGFEAPSFAE